MNKMFFLLFAISVVILTSVTHCQTIGHWKRIRVDSLEKSSFFLNRDYGIVGDNSLDPNYPPIARTTDGGKSWKNITNLPSYIASNTGASAGNINSIFMRDSLTGWFTFVQSNLQSQNGYFHNGIYHTTDGGLSWVDLVDSAQWETAIESSPGVLAVSTGGIAFQNSQNGIRTVATSPLIGTTGNSLTGRTMDGGLTWQSITTPAINGNMEWEAWNIYCHKRTATYILYHDCSDLQYPQDTDGIISTDFGQTWRVFHLNNSGCSSPNETTGGIAGAGDAIYMQTLECGLYRSTDDGNTWISVGGPSFGTDTKLFAPSVCNGSVVIASGGLNISGYQNGVWMTTDGGDGTIPLPNDTLTIQPGVFDTVSSCDSSITPIVFGNCGCSPADYHFDSALVAGDARFSIVNKSLFPTAWNGFASRDTLFIKFSPQHKSGLATALVHLHGRIIRDSTITPFDSVILVQAYALGVGPNLQTMLGHNTTKFDLGSVNICNGIDTVLIIRNNGCGPATITAEDLTGSGFDVTQLTLPIILQSDSTITIHIHTHPTDTVQEQGSITLQVSSDSLSQSLKIQLQAEGSWGGGNLNANPSPVQFSTTSLCGSDSVNLTLVNPGCDSVVFASDSFHVSLGYPGDSDFSLLGLLPDTIGANDTEHVVLVFHPSGLAQRSAWVVLHTHDLHGKQAEHDVEVQLNGTGTSNILATIPDSISGESISLCQNDTLTATISDKGCDSLLASGTVSGVGFSLLSDDSSIAPGKTGVYRIVFIPSKQKGTFPGLLKIKLKSTTTGISLDTTIPLQQNVVGGTKVLSADASVRDFGALYACQSRDTIVMLRNMGCDTLRIDSSQLSNGTYRTDGTYPLRIPPDSSAAVQVFLTADSLGMNGTLTFFADSGTVGTPVTIPLTASIIPPARLVLDLTPSDTAADGATVTCYVLLVGSVPSGAISSMNFSITHNDDVLEYENASGVTLSKTAGTSKQQVLQFSADHPPPPPSIGGGVDTMGTITFRAYLSDSGSTPLTLSNVQFTNALSLADNCVASIMDSSASFTYLYKCGEPLIQDALRGMLPFTITSIVPNPAGDEVEVRVAGGDPATLLHFEMYDALGRSALTPASPQPLSLLGEGLSVDVSHVPSGIYVVRVSSGGYVQSRSVAVQH